MEKFKTNDIVVVTSKSKAPCGKVRAYEGEIIKVRNPELDEDDEISVFRGKNKEPNIWSYIEPSKIRIATPEEAELYNKGKFRNISEL